MKEATELTLLPEFELSDLKLVDIGTKIIKIGREMQILEPFVLHVQKSLFSPGFSNFYLPANTTFTTFTKVDCGVRFRSNLGL